MFRRFLIILILIALVEGAITYLLVKATSVRTTALIIGIPSVLGMAVFIGACFLFWRRITQQLSVGAIDEDPSAFGVVLLFASFLLMLPGILSNLLAVTIIATPLRRQLGGWMQDRMVGSHQPGRKSKRAKKRN